MKKRMMWKYLINSKEVQHWPILFVLKLAGFYHFGFAPLCWLGDQLHLLQPPLPVNYLQASSPGCTNACFQQPLSRRLFHCPDESIPVMRTLSVFLCCWGHPALTIFSVASVSGHSLFSLHLPYHTCCQPIHPPSTFSILLPACLDICLHSRMPPAGSTCQKLTFKYTGTLLGSKIVNK